METTHAPREARLLRADPDLVIREARRRQRRRRSVVGGGLCALVVTIVLVAVFVARDDGGSQGGVPTRTSSVSQTPTKNRTAEIVLSADGLGVVAVGTGQSAASSKLTQLLGHPTGTSAGVCRGTTEVEWSDLSVEFTHGLLAGFRYSQGGFADLGKLGRPTAGPGVPKLETAKGATLGMTLAEVRALYPGNAFGEEEGGSVVTYGTKVGDRLFLGFFSASPTSPLAEIKGGSPCGDV